jgi:hypothetical protein
MLKTATEKTHGEHGVFWLNTPLVHFAEFRDTEIRRKTNYYFIFQS